MQLRTQRRSADNGALFDFCQLYRNSVRELERGFLYHLYTDRTALQGAQPIMNLADYLSRISYQGGTEADLNTLRLLHRTHMQAVPFENLDIHIGRSIFMDLARFYHKIVGERRGGFCFEQNGLFFWALEQLGYRVQLLEANVYEGNGTYSRPFDHMTVLAEIDGQRWLCDVGFGESFLEPLCIDHPAPQHQQTGIYRIEQHGDTFIYLDQNEQGEWEIQYRFFLQPRQLSDYAASCEHVQTSPDSEFTHKRICSLARPDGRITLSERSWIETKNDERSERELSGEAEVDQMLRLHFGIDLTPARQSADRQPPAWRQSQ
jgi:N-hydroxyarylamine O-acetyltransferase